jgi:hypothetical protein
MNPKLPLLGRQPARFPDLVRQAELAEDLHRARMNADCPRMAEPALPSFDDQDVDVPATQFDSEHQSYRTAADDHHFMIWLAIHHSVTPKMPRMASEAARQYLSPPVTFRYIPDITTSAAS